MTFVVRMIDKGKLLPHKGLLRGKAMGLALLAAIMSPSPEKTTQKSRKNGKTETHIVKTSWSPGSSLDQQNRKTKLFKEII